jgi:hypothetical protein
VTLTLQRVRAAADDLDRSIAVNARVVRSGTDGVGLAFVPSPSQDSRAGSDSATRAADAKTLQRFFDRVEADRKLNA